MTITKTKSNFAAKMNTYILRLHLSQRTDKLTFTQGQKFTIKNSDSHSNVNPYSPNKKGQK